MCNFFSFVTNGKGNYMYFDWEAGRKYICPLKKDMLWKYL